MQSKRIDPTSNMPPRPRHSGMQKNVFSLYRKILREAAKKDRTTTNNLQGNGNHHHVSFESLLNKNHAITGNKTSTTTSFAAAEFRRQALEVKRSDFQKIEYLIRKGEKQIKLLQMPGVKIVGGTWKKGGVIRYWLQQPLLPQRSACTKRTVLTRGCSCRRTLFAHAAYNPSAIFSQIFSHYLEWMMKNARERTKVEICLY